jgi:hypothetical protein
LSANRFEEVNNYSGRMTRRKAIWQSAWDRRPGWQPHPSGVVIMTHLPKSLANPVNHFFAKQRHFSRAHARNSPKCIAVMVW